MSPQLAPTDQESAQVAQELRLIDAIDEAQLQDIQNYFEQRQQNVNFDGIRQSVNTDMKMNNEISVLWSLEEGNELRLGSPSEQAIFLIKWAQEEYYLLHSKLKKYLPTIETDLKDNVIRVAQKIQEEQEKRNLSQDGYRFMTDILRARLVALSIEDLKIKMQIFENIPGVRVIKYKPKFHGVKDAQLRNVTVNFIWSNSSICEL